MYERLTLSRSLRGIVVSSGGRSHFDEGENRRRNVMVAEQYEGGLCLFLNVSTETSLDQ